MGYIVATKVNGEEYVCDWKQVCKECQDWMSKNSGKTILFSSLKDNNDKYMFIVVKSMAYFREFLDVKTALLRSVSNANAHESQKYKNYDVIGTTALMIVDEL